MSRLQGPLYALYILLTTSFLMDYILGKPVGSATTTPYSKDYIQASSSLHEVYEAAVNDMPAVHKILG